VTLLLGPLTLSSHPLGQLGPGYRPRPGPESIRGRGEDSDSLGRPVFAEAGDELALEDEDGDLSYSLADFLGQVVELGFPFNEAYLHRGRDLAARI